MKLIIDIPKEYYETIKTHNNPQFDYLEIKVKEGIEVEEIPNPCIECSQNCCVCELNREKCECQKVYVVKENK